MRIQKTKNTALVPTLCVGTHVPDVLRPVRRGRKAFTLVELMVAMALTIFVMTILTQAFVLSIDTFSGLKGLGDMQENLRAGSNQLRYDLTQNHFEGMRRPSDPTIASQPPREGFFVIYQGAAAPPFETYEGQDLDFMPSYRAVNHVLHMACRLKGNQQQSFYSTQVTDSVPPAFFNAQVFYNLTPAAAADATLITQGGLFRSQWAEVAYFLAPQGTTEELLNPSGAGTPLYGLYRAQFVVVTDKTNISNIPANQGNFSGVACGLPPAGNIAFYTPHDLAALQTPRTRTFTPTTNPVNNGRIWPPPLCSLVVPNVLSFQVEAIQNVSPNALSQTNGFVAANRPPAWDIPGGLYDSASNPPPFTLQGVNITLRVWDIKTRQTRQMSIMQDL